MQSCASPARFKPTAAEGCGSHKHCRNEERLRLDFQPYNIVVETESRRLKAGCHFYVSMYLNHWLGLGLGVDSVPLSVCCVLGPRVFVAVAVAV